MLNSNHKKQLVDKHKNHRLKLQNKRAEIQYAILSETISIYMHFVGPLLDDGQRRGTPKALEGLHLPLLVCVFQYVCLLTSYRSQFSTQERIFFNNDLQGYGKYGFVSFLEIIIVDAFKTFLDIFFHLCLCIGHTSPHSTYKRNDWHVGSI